jgi:hypothetical protein
MEVDVIPIFPTFFYIFHMFHHIFPIFFHGGSPLFPLLQSPGPSRSKAMLGKVGNQLVMCLLLNFNHYILERSSDTPIAYNIL